jgi:hypothetical protein
MIITMLLSWAIWETRQTGPRGGGRLERFVPNVDNLQSILDFLRQVLDILAILCRKQDCFDACAKSTDELFLDATNSRNPSAEGNFALDQTC